MVNSNNSSGSSVVDSNGGLLALDNSLDQMWRWIQERW
jgi:hypothetical protein